MAEFCVDCWNKLINKNLPPKAYILSRNPELCEHCGEYKRVVIIERRDTWFRYVRPFALVLERIYIWNNKRRDKKQESESNKKIG